MLIDQIEDVARQAGEILLNAVHPKVFTKEGHANFCTETDEKVQEFLIGELRKVVPEA